MNLNLKPWVNKINFLSVSIIYLTPRPKANENLRPPGRLYDWLPLNPRFPEHPLKAQLNPWDCEFAAEAPTKNKNYFQGILK